MRIYLWRHGQAEPYRADDETRQLVTRGREDVNNIALTLTDELSRIQRLLVSPYVRTRQTAAVIQPFLPTLTPQLSDWLTPDAQVQTAIDRLAELDDESVLLVTHQPLVGRLVEQLCGLAPGYIAMDTAALACVETGPVAAGLGELLWLKQP